VTPSDRKGAIIVVRVGRVATVLAATVLATGFVAGAATPVAAGGTAPDQGRQGSQGDVFQTQIRLITAADLIKGVGGDGYAGISVEARRGELEVYWKGELPAQVADIVERARRDMDVRVLPAAHSERELLAAAQRLAKEPGVASVGPKADGSGLTLWYAGDVAIAAALPAIRDAGVAVDLRPGEYAQPTQITPPSRCAVQLISRQNDNCQWGGGATFMYPVGAQTARCTTGWPVKYRSWTGFEWQSLLTAGHCGQNGLTVYDGAGSRIGITEGDDDTKDTMLIAADGSPRMFVGWWGSNAFKPIRMPVGNYPNTLVCTSGAMSGQHCDLRVEATNLTVNARDAATGRVYTWFPMVSAWSEPGPFAVASGDSGGPVAAQDSPTESTGGIVYVYAAGTISGGNTAVSCPSGSTAQPGQTCLRRVFYAPLQESLTSYGLTLMTG
jgi:hypothetical protein